MPAYTFTQLLSALTVLSHDDGRKFTDTTRLESIRSLLAGSDYTLLKEDKLFLLYGRRPVEGEEIVLISSHIDCVYNECYCQEREEYYEGTFDNSLTNAAVIYDMLAGLLPDNVYIAFTGDEEKDSNGAKAVMGYLARCGCVVSAALVTDVTNEGWDDEAPFTLENDLGLDLFMAFRIVDSLDSFLYTFIHHAEPDESWDYADAGIPSLTVCIPVMGDMHNDAGVLARKSSVPVYCNVLALLASVVND